MFFLCPSTRVSLNQHCLSHRPGFSLQAIVSEIRTWRPRCDGRSRSARRSTRWLLRRSLKSAATFSVCRSTSSCGGSDSPEIGASEKKSTTDSFVRSADRISRISRSRNSAARRFAKTSAGTWFMQWYAVTLPRCAFWTRTVSVWVAQFM